MLIDEAGNTKGILSRGEHKSIHTDRVTLVPGPENEIAVVNQIFEEFVRNGMCEAEIATDLNSRGIKTDLDRSWTSAVIRQILTNEKYIGNNIWNGHSFKLKKRKCCALLSNLARYSGTCLCASGTTHQRICGSDRCLR